MGHLSNELAAGSAVELTALLQNELSRLSMEDLAIMSQHSEPTLSVSKLPSGEECNSSTEIERLTSLLESELRSLRLKRAVIAKRIGVIRGVIYGLADVFGSDVKNEELRGFLSGPRARSTPLPRRGLTEACRRVLMGSLQPLTVSDLCSKIQEINPAILARHKRPRVSVTVVLRRLVDYGEIRADVNEESARTWEWIAPRKQSKATQVFSSSQLPLQTEGEIVHAQATT